jgi:hypothetical protein
LGGRRIYVVKLVVIAIIDLRIRICDFLRGSGERDRRQRYLPDRDRHPDFGKLGCPLHRSTATQLFKIQCHLWEGNSIGGTNRALLLVLRLLIAALKILRSGFDEDPKIAFETEKPCFYESDSDGKLRFDILVSCMVYKFKTTFQS